MIFDIKKAYEAYERQQAAHRQKIINEAVEKHRPIWEIEKLNEIKKEIGNSLLIFCGYELKTLADQEKKEMQEMHRLKSELKKWKKIDYPSYLKNLLGEDTPAARDYLPEDHFLELKKATVEELPYIMRLHIQSAALYGTAAYYVKTNGRRTPANLYNVNVPWNLPILHDRDLLYYYLTH